MSTLMSKTHSVLLIILIIVVNHVKNVSYHILSLHTDTYLQCDYMITIATDRAILFQ